jgi:cell division septation protein DedD
VSRNEDGEFELVLGNRQLLSVFFIVVVLLGVFFTMGYIVGRNSSPVLAEASKKAEKPVTVDSTIATETQPAPSTETAAPKETAPQVPAEAPVPPETTKSEKKVAPVEAAPSKPAAEKPEKKAESKPEPPKKARPAANDQPVAGQSYLQLAATTKHEADVMVDVLRQKGFKAIAAEIQEKPGTYRVLVGPVAEGGRNALRADLQKSGFPGNAALPRTF